MLRVGDRVQPWHRHWSDRWSFSVPAGVIVEEIKGPMPCECATWGIDCYCEGERDHSPYYYVRCSLLPPFHQRSHDSYYRVCAIPDRPWQMRRNGTALVLLERRETRMPAAPQLDLFA